MITRVYRVSDIITTTAILWHKFGLLDNYRNGIMKLWLQEEQDEHGQGITWEGKLKGKSDKRITENGIMASQVVS
jgi:hypothetical protein